MGSGFMLLYMTKDNFAEVEDDAFFVTFEGLDKSGKSTALDFVDNHDLFGDALYTTEPYDDSWAGKIVRAMLGDGQISDPDDEEEELVNKLLEGEDISTFEIFHMFMVDHYKHIEERVLPQLRGENEGIPMVVSDRYVHSRYAYQAESLDGHFDEIDTLSWIRDVQEGHEGHLHPDLTVFIDISIEEFAERKSQDDNEAEEIFEKADFQNNVRENYHRLAEEDDSIVIVDGEQPPEEVGRECVELILEYAPDELVENF